MQTERNSFINKERLMKLLKASDVIGIALGIVVGGAAGAALIVTSAGTYVMWNKIEKSGKGK